MKVFIIGAGASGLMAAHIAAKNGNDVTLIEKMPRVGKKILSTGGGRCNLSNTDMDLSHFHGGDISFVERVFEKCSKDDTLSEFTKLGLYTVNKNGYLYPYSEQATAVLDILRLAIAADNVNVITDSNVLEIVPTEKKSGNSFKIKTDKGEYSCNRLIICTGSKAFPKSGSDGSGYNIVKKLGHEIIKPLPALCGLRCEGDYFKSIAGIRCKGLVRILVDGNEYGRDAGEIQLTNYGISGIPVMQVSHLAAKALDEGKKVQAVLSFVPEFEKEGFAIFIKNRIMNNPNRTAEELFAGLFNKNISVLLMKKCNISLNCRVLSLSDAEIDKIAGYATNFSINVLQTNSFDECQVCQGGINLKEVKDTLESKIVPGLYFAGEILDVHGDCGGYNLQWAWSTGMLAGRLK